MHRYAVCSFVIARGGHCERSAPARIRRRPSTSRISSTRRSCASICAPNELTAYYLVDLLCGFMRPDKRPRSATTTAAGVSIGRALESGGLEQRARLRNLGDFSLFMSGFFSDSFRRRAVDVDYYVSMGEYAYGSLEPPRRRRVRRRLRGAGGQVRGVHRRAVGRERADRPGVPLRHPAALREVAADAQPARRPASRGPRHHPQRARSDPDSSSSAAAQRRPRPWQTGHSATVAPHPRLQPRPLCRTRPQNQNGSHPASNSEQRDARRLPDGPNSR